MGCRFVAPQPRLNGLDDFLQWIFFAVERDRFVLGKGEGDRRLGVELLRRLGLGQIDMQTGGIIGAVTMKMINRTSMTSTSGVTLISAWTR